MNDYAQWDPSGTDRVIAGDGTPEAAWQAWPGLHALQAIGLEALVPPGRRAVIVAPHPDDEVLGTGGLITALLARQLAAGSPGEPPVRVVAVTDGTGSHPGSPLWPAHRLAAVRAAETDAALATLAAAVAPMRSAAPAASAASAASAPPAASAASVAADPGAADQVTRTHPAVSVLRVHLPDGSVGAHEEALCTFLQRHCRADDVLFSSWRFDGHPDHEAVGRASARAAAALSARLIELPIWAWHWAQPGDPRLPWDRARRLLLSDSVTQAKRLAAQAYPSQLDADPSTGAAPILPPYVLARVLRAFELFFI